MPELLNATRIRIAQETAVGSGVATGGWREIPTTGAAIDRELVMTAQRMSLHGQLSAREVIADAWGFRMAHEANLALVAWMIQAHLTDQGGGVWQLDPEADGPSFVIETTSEGGDIAAYTGTKLTELQMFWEERRVIQLETQWSALRRQTLVEPLAGAAGAALAGPMLPTRLATMAATPDAWGGNPRVDDAITTHGGQIVMTREIEPRNYGPDGIPDTFNLAAWQVLAEIYLPETPGITDTAYGEEWIGRLAMWFGSGTQHLRINQAHGVLTDEDLKAYDWRVRRLTAEAVADNSRATLEFRA